MKLSRLVLSFLLCWSMASVVEAKTQKHHSKKPHASKKISKKKTAKVLNKDMSIDQLNDEITRASLAEPVTAETHDKKDFNLATDGYGGYIQ